MVSSKMMVTLLALLVLAAQQNCPQLCATNCSAGNCTACWAGFSLGSNTTTASFAGTCACPTGTFLNSTSALCSPCPVTCLTCFSYSRCSTCIPGFLLSNDFACIPGALTANGWVSKDVSFDLSGAAPSGSNIRIVTNGSAVNLAQAASVTGSCQKLPGYNWLGGKGVFGYKTKVVKSLFGLPPHQWLNVRFHAVLIDKWVGNTLLLEFGSKLSSLGDLLSPQILWQGSFASQLRNADFCGNNSIADNLAVVDAWIPHNLSSTVLRIRLNESEEDFNATSNLNQAFFAVRELYIRVGTCGKGCKACSQPSQCIECILPYTLSINGSCICNSSYGFVTASGCHAHCLRGYYYNATANSCLNCEYMVRNCQTCNATACHSCSIGFFYSNSGSSVQCVRYCPSTFTEARSVGQINNQTVITDSCVSCPSNCRTCNYNICLFCVQGFVYYKGSCLSACPPSTFLTQGSCFRCPANCLNCTTASSCSACIPGFAPTSSGCLPFCYNTTVLASGNRTCNYSCSSNCSSCYGPSDSQCLACSSGFLQAGMCTSVCNIGSFQSGNQCIQCPLECQSCSSQQNCLTCYTGYYRTTSSSSGQSSCARVCPPSFFPTTATNSAGLGECLSCSLGCQRCKSVDFCMECSENYYNFNFTCMLAPPISYYFDRELRHFKPCQSNCLKCNQMVCYRCSAGYFLNQGVCVTDCGPFKYKVLQKVTTSYSRYEDNEEDSEDSENSEDSDNQEARRYNITQFGFCQWRSPKCEDYDETALNGSCVQCSNFQPSLVLRSTSSSTSNCYFSCPEFYTQSINSTCLPCPQNCRRCTSSMQCLECIHSYVINHPDLITSSNLMNQTCIRNYCPEPYFSDSTQCLKCRTGCSVCQIDGRCLACSNAYLLDYKSGICYQQNCSSYTQFYKIEAGLCQTCASPCLTCSSISFCTSCIAFGQQQLYLYEGTCQNMCPPGYFAHRQSGTCRKCNSKCATCLTFYNCLTCAPSFYLLSFYSEYQAQCVAECPIGFYSDTKACQSCHRDCKSCYGPSKYQCLTCYSNFLLDESECVYACSNGKYADEYGHCDWCDSSCNDCNGPTPQNCISCGLGYYIADNVCYKDLCPGATYLAHAAERICERCQFGCSVCSSPQFCRFCFPGFNLYRGWCYSQCPGNLISTTHRFANLNQIEGYICQECLTLYSANCRRCDKTHCSRCSEGYFLYKNSRLVVSGTLKEQCVTVCPAGTYVKSSEVRECVSCQANCLSCTAYQKCLLCASPYNLINGYCSLNCPSGAYLSVYQNCSTCASACATCSSGTSCSSCKPGYFLYYNSSGNACLSSCPSGYFADSRSGWCSRCLSTCSACTATNNCTQCLSGFSLANNVCHNQTSCSAAYPYCQSCSGQNCLKCVQPYLLYIHRASSASSCVTACPAGYFASIFTCEACNSSCSACANSAGNCLQCSPGLYLYGQNCVPICPVGFYANSALQTCQACSANCLNCQQTTCYSCQSGHFLFQGQCYSSCPIATYASAGAGICYNCPTNCTSCSGDENCTGCSAGSMLYNGSCIQNCPRTTFTATDALGNNNCQSCVSPCYTCTHPSTCISCIPNYILNGTTCQQACNSGYYFLTQTIVYDGEDQNYDFSNFTQCYPCDAACSVCSSTPTTCQACNAPYILYGSQCIPSCPPGTFLNSTKCLSCSPSCVSCNASETCQVCANNTILYSGKCVISCPAAFYMANQANSTQNQYVCQPCSSGCRSCSGPSLYECTNCENGHYLAGSGDCVTACPSGTYANNLTQSCSLCPYGCNSCISAMNCSSCISNYTLTSTNQCKSYSSCSVPNCQFCSATNSSVCSQCVPTYFIYNSYCVTSCPPSTYAQNGLCNSCPANCIACTASECLACNSLSFLYQRSCVTSCPVGTYQVSGRCQSDPCLAYNSATNDCLQCANPYLLYSKPMLYLNVTYQITECVLSCPAGTIQSGSTCASCPQNCLNCISPSICSACTAGTFLYLSSCQNSCPLGTFVVNSVCQSCTLAFCSQCTSLNGTQSCVSCSAASGAFLFNGTCVLVCPAGTYGSAASQSCYSCSQNCLSCTSPQSCSNCSNGYSLYLGQCVLTCPVGTFASGSSCSPCSPGCIQCLSASSCSLCQSSYALLNTSNSSQCVSACPAGYYSQATVSSAYSNSNQFKCALCQLPCLTCSSVTACTQCIANFFLLGGVCQQICPEGYFGAVSQTVVVNSITYSTGVCSRCSPACLTCANISSNCLSCPSGQVLDSNNNCVSNCASATTYYVQTTRTCYNCSQQCYSCYGPGTDNCLSCRPPLQLYSGSCFSACPYSYYSTAAYVCQPCASPCLACAGTASNCTACNTATYLQTAGGVSTCSTSCPSGYYMNAVLQLCSICNANCLTCANSNQCLSCPSGMYLFNQACFTACPAATAPSTASSLPSCSPCPANCLSCISSASQSLSCIQCSANYYLVNGICSQNCPAGTYSSPTSYSCVDCGIAGCQSCLLNASLTPSCTACQPNFFSYNGVCVDACPNGTVATGSRCTPQPVCLNYQWNGYCLSTCPSGTFPAAMSVSASSTQSAFTCLNCSALCTSCTSLSSCSSCANNTYLYTVSSNQSTCVSSCPTGSYLRNSTCQSCFAPCLACQLSSTGVDCVTCQPGFLQLGSSCLSACPLGYFQSGAQCSECSAICASCVGTASNCTACKNVNANAPSCATSVNCTGSQYQTSNTSCSSCSSNCLTCYGGASYECLSCANSSNILIGGSCIATCPAGTARSNATCVNCPSNCLTCAFNAALLSCTTCASSFILFFSGSNVGTCIQSCSSLGNGTQNYVMVNGQCQLCTITGCLLCSYASGQFQCNSCMNTTYLYNQQCVTVCPPGTMSSSNVCISCRQNCTACTPAGCSLCATGYYLQEGNCVSSCGFGYYSANGTCLKCTIANCLSCNGSACLSCQQPFVIDSLGHCNSCVNGYFMLSGVCQACSPQCLTCAGSSNACTSCAAGYYVFNSSTCVTTCPSGYFPTSAGACSVCTVTNCQACSSTSCTSCLSGFVLLNQGSQSCQTSCPAAMYLSTSTNSCINCSSFCTACSSSTSCSACASPSVLSQGYCLSSCPSGYYTVNQTCVICPSGCKTCTSSLSCTSCNAGMTVNSNGTCSVPVSNCPNGYYLNTLSSCSQCFPTCMTCSAGNSNNCITCFSGYMFSNGVCIQNCDINSFYNANSTCQLCSSAFPNCVSCTGSSCLSCTTNYTVLNGNCVQSCPSGTFLSNSNCLSCPAFCTSCTSSSNCTQCLNSTLLLISGLCYTSCPAQTFFSNNTCASCYQTCLTCAGPSTYCSSCITPYNLYGSSCTASCPNGTYSSNYTCQSCALNCLVCTGINTCTLCSSPLYLINGTCRSTCPSGYYVDSASNRCLQCVLPCLVCTSRTSCSSCQSPATLISGLCINSNCTGGYYDISLSACVNCTVNHCGYCTNTSCSSCLSGYYSIYSNGILTYCQPACIARTFADNATMNCSSCFTNCFSCLNSSWCNMCSSGYYVLSVGGALANECVTLCPIGYFTNSALYECTPCGANCASCLNQSICLVCNSYYYQVTSNGTVECATNCPPMHFTPTSIDGTGQCGQCGPNCYACLDALNCTQCISSSDVVVSGTCTPYRCVHCFACHSNNNTCARCAAGYFLFSNACFGACPDGYYGDNSTGQCLSCVANCLLCEQPDSCMLCISGYIFVNGSACENAGLLKFGVLGNMSGFTSNITKIMAIVYVSTSSGPIAFGAIGSTYGPMQFCQFMYLLQGSSGGNEEVNHFLNSLSAVSYTTSSGTNENSNSTGSSSARLLTAINYTSTFLETNLPIFLIMISFVSAYILVVLLQKYGNSCCSSSPCLQKYINYICDFMQKRFKYIYVDTVMWISYLPFLYFAILQLKSGRFDSGMAVFSSLLAIAIIVLYPLYPIFILRKIFDRSSDPAEDLRNYKAITLKEPARAVDEEKPMCADVTCCSREDPTVSMVEMSLSPYIEKVVRPVYNEFDPDYSEFRYFKIEHWRLAYAPIKYVRKFIYVLIVALCPDPITTLSLLVVVTAAYIVYLAALRPKEKLYLVLEIILESVLLFFIVFMMVYVSKGGAAVSQLSIVTHAIGFLLANSALAIAIILNLMAYYTIFCCVVDLIKHLRDRAIEDDIKEKAFAEIVDDKEKIDYKDKDKEEIEIRKSLPRGDDEMTVENNEDENYIPYDLDEKEFNVRSSMIKKKKTFEVDEPEEDFTNLKLTKNPKARNHRRDRKKSSHDIEEESHTSEEIMGQSKISEEHDISGGLLKDKNSKFKREVNRNDVNIDRGEIRQPTDKFRKSRHSKPTIPQEQESIDVLRLKKEPIDEFVAEIDTHDRMVPSKKPEFSLDPTFAERQAKRREKKNEEDKDIEEPYMRERESGKKEPKSNNLSEATPYDWQGKPRNAQNVNDLQSGNLVERERRRKENPFGANDPSDPSSANMYDRQGRRKNVPAEGSNRDIEGVNTYSKGRNQENLLDANMYDRKGDNKRSQGEKDLESANMVERERKKKENPFGEFEEIFALEDNKALKDAQMEERARKEKESSFSNEKLVSGFLVNEADAVERRGQQKKFENLHYKGSDDEEEVREGQVVEAKNKFRKNARRSEKNVPEGDINAVGKDIKTKKVERMQSNRQFVEDTLQEAKYKERQGKEVQKLKSLNEKAQTGDVEEASGYTREKRVAERRKPESQQKIESNSTFLPAKPGKNKPNIYDDLAEDITESVEFKEERKVEPKAKRSNNSEDFEEQNMGKIIKGKPEQRRRVQDNRMQVSENLEESYEDLVRKNKEQMYKQTIKNKSNLIELGEDDDFEEVNYSRPESKIQMPKSRSKDMGLGVNSRAGSEASDNESRDIRKQRNSAIQRQRKKGTLNVNDNESNDEDNEVGGDSRRISRIKKQKSKMVKGVLNIEDKSENEDIQDVHL